MAETSDIDKVLQTIRDGFTQVTQKMDAYEKGYLDRAVFDILFALLDKRTTAHTEKLNNLELRQEEISNLGIQVRHNTEHVDKLDKRMEAAPGRNMQYITMGIAIISVLIVIFQHVKIG